MGITKEEFNKLKHGDIIYFMGKTETINRLTPAQCEQVGTTACDKTMDITNQYLSLNKPSDVTQRR